MGDWQLDPQEAKLLGVEYQRNGIGGIGFYTVDFEHRGDRLIGVVYLDNEDRTAVLNPSNLSRHYRGADYFGPWLREQADGLYGEKGVDIA